MKLKEIQFQIGDGFSIKYELGPWDQSEMFLIINIRDRDNDDWWRPDAGDLWVEYWVPDTQRSYSISCDTLRTGIIEGKYLYHPCGALK